VLSVQHAYSAALFHEETAAAVGRMHFQMLKQHCQSSKERNVFITLFVS